MNNNAIIAKDTLNKSIDQLDKESKVIMEFVLLGIKDSKKDNKIIPMILIVVFIFITYATILFRYF